MIYRDFQDISLSHLGFGTMRLPLLADGKTVDEQAVFAMVDYALAQGVNYFDTAVPYHNLQSEAVVGRALARHPRDSWYLASKYPGHQKVAVYEPAKTFQEQLDRCGVEYFDFYLLHNVCENTMDVYTDPQWGIVDYFVEQRRLGRIKHLGFSSHSAPDSLAQFLDKYGEQMEFCQIQLNYLDWTLQHADEKCRILAERNIPVWVMEPLRGGRLSNLKPEEAAMLPHTRSGMTPTAWALRWVQAIPGVTMILSGMSNLEQMVQNIATFDAPAPLTEAETAKLYALAETMKNTVPCTGCRYCCDSCPQGLDIPILLGAYNDLRVTTTFTPRMLMESLPADKRPEACIGCGQCTAACPQKIDVPEALGKLSSLLASLPTWAQTCKEREEAAKAAAK